MISRETSIIPSLHVADFTGKEGYFVESAAGADSIVNHAADIPLGVITEGLAAGSSIALPSYAGIVKVKVTGAAPGAIVRGSYGTVKNDGTVQLDSGAGARVRVCRFLEAGAANELVDAYLVEPTALT